MMFFLKKKEFYFFLTLVFVCLFFFVPYFVKATVSEQGTVRVFPNSVQGNWSNTDALKENDAVGSVQNGGFTQKNSAYPNNVVYTETESPFFSELPETVIEEKKIPDISEEPSENIEPTAILEELPSQKSEESVESPKEKQQSFYFRNFLKSFISDLFAKSVFAKEKEEVEAENTPADVKENTVSEITESSGTEQTPSEILVEPETIESNTEEEKPEVVSEEISVESVAPTGQFHTESSIVLDDFYLNDEGKEFENTTLMISLSQVPSDYGVLTFEYWHHEEWKKLHTRYLKQEQQAEDSSPISFVLPQIHFVQDLRSLKFRITYKDEILTEPHIFIDAVWVELFPKRKIKNSALSNIESITQETDFQSDEAIDLSFRFKENQKRRQKNLTNTLLDFIGSEELDLSKNTETEVLDPDGNVITSVVPEISYEDNTDILVHIPENSVFKRPGEYALRVKIYDEDKTHEYVQDFTVGVLAVNLNQTIFLPNESVYIQVGVLDEKGGTICDASLDVMVKNPDGSISNVSVQPSSTCGPKTVTDTPDYFGYYSPTLAGDYEVTVINYQTNTRVSEYFSVVADEPEFRIERIGATRIYPLAPYTMQIGVTANADFTGTFSEVVPSGFVISNAVFSAGSGTAQKSTLLETPSGTIVSADMQIKKGETYHFSYTYDAPDITPYLFLLGPTKIESDEKTYVENRQWQLASDDFVIIEPDADGTLECTPTPTGTHFSTIDDHITQPSTGDTSDYIVCQVSEADYFRMTTVSNVSTASEMDVWVYYENKVNEAFSLELWDANETTQYGTTQELQSDQGITWHRATFSGLTLTQAQLDDLKIRVEAITSSNSSNGSASTVYSLYAYVTYTLDNQPPSVSSVTINNGSTIVLTPATTTAIAVTGVVTDNKGYADVVSATARLFRSGVSGAQNCTLDDDDCYQSSSCSFQNCSGNSCDVSCTVNLQYYADPTDAGTPFASESWNAYIFATDTLSLNGSAAATTQKEVQSVAAVSLSSSSLSYGTLNPGSTAEQQNAQIVVTQQGNTKVDLGLLGSNFVNESYPGKIIPAANQRFSIGTDKTYATSTALSASDVTSVGSSLAKKTSVTSQATETVWFSLLVTNIPAATFSNTVSFLSQVSATPW